MNIGGRYYKVPKAAVFLITLNVLYFIVLTATGSTLSSSFMLEKGALYAPYVLEKHEYYRLVTSMFMHFGFQHLFSNMLLLFYMGMFLEEDLGSLFFVFIYMICGLVGNIASVIYYSAADLYSISAGASGAVFGLVGVEAWLVFSHHGRYRGIGSRQIILMLIFTFYNGSVSSGINNTAHVAGLLTGVLCGMLFSMGNGRRGSKQIFY